MSNYFKRQNRSNYNGYSKMDKEDPEDTIHRKAQFLIYKAMEEAETVAGGGSHSHQKKTTTTMSSFLRMRFCKVKLKIGSRFKSLRRRMFSTTKAATYMQMLKQLKSCKRLFGAGVGGDHANNNNNVAARLPSLII